MANYILGAVGPSGGPQLCNDLTSSYFENLFPDICSTKSATCCHTPVFSTVYNPISLYKWELLAPLEAPGFYEIYNSNISDDIPSGCTLHSTTGSNVSLRELSSGDVTYNEPGAAAINQIFVNYGATINLSFTIKIPYIQSEFRYCQNLGRLSVTNLNPDNKGVLFGDYWYDNYPSGTGSPFPTQYYCYNNPSITPISYPYASPYPNQYWADINAITLLSDIEAYHCNESNYCCDCYATASKNCIESCPGSYDAPPDACYCMVDSGGPAGPYEATACRTNVPYATLQGTYLYTCDVPCGVEIELINYQALYANENYVLFPGEEASFSITCTTENCL